MSHYSDYLKSVLTNYINSNDTRRDLLELFSSFSDLRPRISNFCFNDGTEKELLNVEGTIPVLYKGQTYNIPIVIWLMQNYPQNPPMVYVNPTANMQIKSGKNVNLDGQVNVPYLRDWMSPDSDLISLVQILSVAFGEEPPVYSSQQGVREVSITKTNSQMDRRRVDREQIQRSLNTLSEYENALLTSLKRLKYENTELVKTDVIIALTEFKDLEYTNDFYVYEDGYRKRLLKLNGTIPVKFQGADFNVPIAVWLGKRYPHKAPMVYVVPSARMHVMSGNFVDMNGKVQIPCLTEWSYPETDLHSLLQVLATVFAEELPVQSKLMRDDVLRVSAESAPAQDASNSGPTGDSVPGQTASSFEFAGEVPGRGEEIERTISDDVN